MIDVCGETDRAPRGPTFPFPGGYGGWNREWDGKSLASERDSPSSGMRGWDVGRKE